MGHKIEKAIEGAFGFGVLFLATYEAFFRMSFKDTADVGGFVAIVIGTVVGILLALRNEESHPMMGGFLFGL